MPADHRREKRHGILLDQPLDDPERCRHCDGACCRAFPSVRLDWSEYRRLSQLGATRLAWSPYDGFHLSIENSCEFLADGCCLIYADRPDICRRFYCTDIPPAGPSRVG